jgi:thymidylate synthase (FAD)
MNVKLISYTPDPERTVAAAARMCYSPVGAQRILEDFKDEEVEGFLRKILVLGHLSPTEHASFTFSITGSRVMTHQLVRHRIASYSQKSQRYISEGNFTYTTPPSIKANPEAEAVFKKAMEDVKNSYNLLIELGINREDARFVLPNACETNIICTFNTRSLYNFFKLRCCERAQWEIRGIATEMLQQVKAVAPVLFEKAGPPCISEGFCPEGEMSCGRINRIKSESQKGGS